MAQLTVGMRFHLNALRGFVKATSAPSCLSTSACEVQAVGRLRLTLVWEMGHVWTAPSCQGIEDVVALVGAAMCLPISAAHRPGGHCLPRIGSRSRARIHVVLDSETEAALVGAFGDGGEFEARRC